ncbi:uncharacterized protein V6R79_020794 [Siganus canaliculatus]
MHNKNEIIANLKKFDIGNKLAYLPVLPKASVLIPLFMKNGEIYTLMTLRSKEVNRIVGRNNTFVVDSAYDRLVSVKLRSNAGEVCFPGGKRDPSDKDDVDTALREAKEEIGLPPEEVEVVCRLFPIINKSGLLVTPVVGFIEESFNPCSNPAEVSAVFPVPLEFFIREKDHIKLINPPGMVGMLHSFDFKDLDSGSRYHIWGLTAALAIMVAVLALKKNPEFDVGFSTDDPLPFFQQVLHRRISKL